MAGKAALVLDNPKRDLGGVVLVAYELLKRGVEPYLVPMYQQGYDIPLIAPDVVLANYARLNNQALLEGYRSLGCRVMVMDTEGGIVSESGNSAPDNWGRLFRESGLNQVVDHYFFWGPRIRDAFAAAGALPADALEVTGCPRYDLCAPQWRPMLRYRESGFVLVNTNFATLNPRFSRAREDEMETYMRTGWPRDYTERLFGELSDNFPRYLDAVEGLARRHAGRRVVIRPHPFENAAFYEKRFGALPNVRVDAEGEVFNVISAADCVVHLNCGTAVETLLLGKTPISLEYINRPFLRQHNHLPSAISCTAHDEAHLDRLIADPAARAEAWDATAVRERYLEPWFHVIDGKASARIAARMAAVEGRTARRSLALSLGSGLAKPRPAQVLQGFAVTIAGSRVVAAWRAAAVSARRDKQVAPETVSALLADYARCEGSGIKATVRPARHPLTGMPLATLHISAAAAS